MTLNERLELIRAGYTKEEISAFDTPAPEPNPTPAPEPNPTPAPEPNPAPAPEPNPAPAPEPNPAPTADNSEVLAAITALTKAIQLSNLHSASRDTNNDMTPEQALAAGVFGVKK